MKGVPSKPASETLDTLSESARPIIEAALEGAAANFADKGEIHSVIIALPEGDECPKLFDARHGNDMEKDVVWAFLRMIRATHPVTVLISECWYLQLSKEERKDLNNLPQASKSKRRKEMVMVNLWDCERSVTFSADISRNPNKLSEFVTVHDSMFPIGEAKEMGGALCEGEPYRKEED